MTTHDLFRCIGDLSDEFIEEAAEVKRRSRWLPIAALAACAVLAISIPLALRGAQKSASTASDSSAAIERPAEDASLGENETTADAPAAGAESESGSGYRSDSSVEEQILKASLNGLQLGMTSEQVRQLLGDPDSFSNSGPVQREDGLWEIYNNYHMGTTAENINDIWGITRQEQDEFAAASQQKAEAAQAAGRFDAEIVPVPVKVKKNMVDFNKDEFPKAGVTAEGISKLRGAFALSAESPNPQVVHTFEVTGARDAADKGTPRVTAANASGINDGAAAIVLASGEAVKKYNLKPMAKLIGWGQGGVDPKIMGVGPVPASRQAMAKAGVTIDDIDLVEANEAFAAQSIAVARELHFDMSKVNVNGGAISIGHPVGASGARIIVTLLHEMLKRPEAKKGLATLCIGGGQGVATVFEKC